MLDSNGDVVDKAKYHSQEVIYTASISKLLILLAVSHEISENVFDFDDQIKDVNPNEKAKLEPNESVRSALKKMIYESSNKYAGVAQRLLSADNKLGKLKTAQIIEGYGYGKGVFWVGKGYQNGKSYPGIAYNHEGTADSVTSFYKRLFMNDFFHHSYRKDETLHEMKEILKTSKFLNRFYGELVKIGFPEESLYRKSGSWTGNGSYSDSVAIQLSNQSMMIMSFLTQGKSCIRAGSKNWHSQLIRHLFH